MAGSEASAVSAAWAAAGAGLWRIDLRTGRDQWCDAMLGLYGLPAGAATPARDEWRSRFLHPEDAAGAAGHFARCLSAREPFDAEYRVRRVDGAVRRLYTRGAAAPDGALWIGISIDVTDRHDAATAGAQARDQALAERLRAEAASGLSHELRTPLNAMLGFAQLLASDTESLSEVQRERARQIEAAGWELLALIERQLANGQRGRG